MSKHLREPNQLKEITKDMGYYSHIATRAIHLEVAGDLSTYLFIMSLRRFISRRGNSSIFSDNGTNLVVAKKELRLALKKC